MNIGFVLTSANSNIDNAILEVEKLAIKNKIFIITSFNCFKILDNNQKEKLKKISQNGICNSIHKIKKIKNLDLIVLEPCTSNSLSKLTNNIIDTPALMISKLYLNKEIPIIIGISSFNGISSSLESIGKLINTKNIFIVPFRQINPITKPNYLVSDFGLTEKTIEYALKNIQIQPILI